MHLSVLDWAMLLLFVAAILTLGFSAKLRQNTILQYLAAGRSLSLPLFLSTLVVTWYGGILGAGESVTFYGVGAWLLLGVPYYIFALIYGLFFARKVRAADQISIPERLELRWGKGVALLGALLIFLMAVPAAHVLMLGVLVQCVTGWGLFASVLVGTGVGTLFLYRGGLLADVRAATLAFVMMYVGFAVMVIWCLCHQSIGSVIQHLPPAQRTITGGNSFAVIVSFMILGAWTMVDPAFHQRVASAADPKTGQKGVFIAILFWALFDLLSMTTALYAMAMMPKMPEEALQIYPLFGDQVLPSGLKGIFYCGMLGTILCAMVAYTLVSGATIGREIVARVMGGMDETQTTLWTRIGIGIACIVAILLAKVIPSVVGLWYSWGGVVIGALLLPVCLSYMSDSKRKIGSSWVFWSIALGFTVSLSWLFYCLRTENANFEVCFVKDRGTWHMILDPKLAKAADSIRYSVGTLLPGLVLSGVILGLGSLTRGRNLKDG